MFAAPRRGLAGLLLDLTQRVRRAGAYDVIQAMIPVSQGGVTVERMCGLAGVTRAGYYRHWGASAPRQGETGVRDAVQRLALAHEHYG